MDNIYIKYSDELCHHGIKGQRWGVRRYQNADGSLTAAGRKKYDVGEARDKKKEDKAAKKAAKKEARAEKKAAIKERKRRAAIDRAMKTGPGAASKALNLSKIDLDRETERYKRAADYMDQRSRVDKKIDEYLSKEKSSFERKFDTAVNYADKVAKIAGSAGKIYDAYKKISGGDGPTEQERIALEKSKLDLENTRLNLQRTTILVNKASHEFNKTLNDESWNNRVNRAKKSSIFRSKKLSDEQLNDYTERHRKENDFLDELFKQYDRVKK